MGLIVCGYERKITGWYIWYIELSPSGSFTFENSRGGIRAENSGKALVLLGQTSFLAIGEF